MIPETLSARKPFIEPKRSVVMEHPTPQQALSARLNEFTISIRLLLDAGYTLSALVMLYAATDIFGSLLRSEREPDTKGEYFKKWWRIT